MGTGHIWSTSWGSHWILNRNWTHGYQDSKKEVFSKYVLHQWTQRYFHLWSLVIRDPLLIYESNVLQTFRPGNIRKKRNQETRERDQTIDEIVEVNIPRVDLDVNDIEDEINKPDGHYGPTQYITIQHNSTVQYFTIH